MIHESYFTLIDAGIKQVNVLHKKYNQSTRSCLIIAPLDNCPPFVKTRKKIFPNFFFKKNIFQFVFYKKSFSKFVFVKKIYFFQICFFTAEVSHFLGQKIQKHFFFLKKYFPKLFFHKNIFFHFFFTAEVSHFLGQKIQKNIFMQKQFWKIFF